MPLKWRQVWIADETFEAAGVFDVNHDGIPDIVSGAFWYEGPEYRKKHFIGEVKSAGEYYDDFSTVPLDGGATRCAGAKTPKRAARNGRSISSRNAAM
jgi:hypothetical protein